MSFATAAAELPVFEYAEVFLDPASPLAGARQFAQLLLKKDAEISDRIVRALADVSPRRADVKRSYRESLALPFSQLLEGIAARPLYGPRERQELEALLDRMDALHADLLKAIVARSPSTSTKEIEERLKPALDEAFESIEKELERAGQPLPVDVSDPTQRIHFKAVLVMPAAITRANTCVQGDTATWEFDQDDLYGRGFEMWAKAGGR